MRIQIDIPDVKCVRCGALGVHEPSVLQIAKDGAGTGRDSRGRVWKVAMSKMPVGWETLTPDRSICPTCAKAWHSTMGAFVSGVEPAPEKEVAPSLSWPEVEAAERARVGNKVSGVPAIVAVAGNAEKAEVSRGSNIPSMAPPPNRVVNYHRPAPNHVQSVVVSAPVPQAMPTSVPNAPRSTAASRQVSYQAASPVEQKIQRSFPNQDLSAKASKISTGTIPQQAQIAMPAATSMAVPCDTTRADPMPQQPEPVGVRVDRVIAAEGK